MEYLKEYAVVFTYNFDQASEIYLFGSDYDGAVQFLKESFEKELKTETEENEWEDVESWHDDEWTWAYITHWVVGVGHDDCEYRLCTEVRRMSK